MIESNHPPSLFNPQGTFDTSKESGLFTTFKTYACDLPILEKLGLKPFEGKTRSTIEVGEYENKEINSKVIIKVTGLPAQFWSFDIFCGESKTRTIIETGSDGLVNYWPYVESMMEGMIVAKKIEPIISLNEPSTDANPANEVAIDAIHSLSFATLEEAELARKGVNFAITKVVEQLRKISPLYVGKTVKADEFLQSLAGIIETTPFFIADTSEPKPVKDQSFGE